MNPLEFVKSNWRILLLVVLLAASAYFLFVPGAPIAGGAAQADGVGNNTAGMTNIQFGIDLAGGARISAPPDGFIATNTGVTEQNNQEIKRAVANATNATQGDVVTSVDLGRRGGFPSDGAVEVRADVDRQAFLQGLQNAGLDVSNGNIQPGVSDYTVSQMVKTIDDRLGDSGFGGGSVTRVQTPNEPRDRVRIEAPGRDLQDLRGLVESRGRVEIVAHYPAQDGSGAVQTVVLTPEDFEADTVARDESGTPYVPITLTQSAADEMTAFMQNSGFARGSLSQVNTCPNDPPPDQYCLLTKVDNETVYSSGMSNGLAREFQTGQFRQSRSFRVNAPDFSTAQELLINMRSGALPTTLDFEDSTEALVSPALAEDFRRNALLTGVIAVIAVVLTVFARYGDPRIAAPMAATALSEVVILLGFAAAIGWPLELSHIAGFIAVIGTGVDDLIIIADEIHSYGEARSRRVFQNRFRKAFWVIGAAALTTIVAMAPLAILNLGELRGFAIVTILGVLLGVGVSRPAYGSILRRLTTDTHGR